MSIALTQTVQKGGCAAKVSATSLRKILSQLNFPAKDSQVLVDGGTFDDAAIYQISDSLALVQTLDFFTPILDTPKFFGEVAAANSLSDVYAMGGKPKTAMGILAFPLANMADEVIVDVLQGACNKIAEAGANFVGGHSIDDDTLKFGLSVTGFVNPKQMWTNAGAKVGDHLILTKALGTGTMTAGLKRQELSENNIIEAIKSMSLLNNVVDYLNVSQLNSIHAATDITGFGLSGHSMQMAKASHVTLKIKASLLPLFDKTLLCLEKGFLTKAHRTNSEYTQDNCQFKNIDKLFQLVLNDPQTSGGLLLSVSPEYSGEITNQLKTQFPATSIIGEVEPLSSLAVFFEN